ncbi:hypothetical protein ASD04_14885 [Devosia sp. Root436]|nr:hypothetical protein ASD04_14885 [Devosia sp. Root436]
MSDDAVATALGISAPTLRKHFSHELDVGTAKTRAELLLALHQSAMAGNVSAQKKALELVTASAAGERLKDRETAPAASAATPASALKRGKKEIQKQAAEEVAEGGKFAPPPGPRLVHSK